MAQLTSSTLPADGGIANSRRDPGRTVVKSALELERLSVGALLVELRERGIADVAQVDLGILEPDGRFSFLVETGGGDRPDGPRL